MSKVVAEASVFLEDSLDHVLESKINIKQATTSFLQLLGKHAATQDELKQINELIFNKGTQAVVKFNKDKQVLDVMHAFSSCLFSVTPAATTTTSSAGDYALFFPSKDNLFKLVDLLKSATKTLDICVFTITDDRIAKAILFAHNHGAQVRVITDNDKSQDLGSDIQTLQSAGIPCVMDNTSFHMHNKYAIIDKSTLVNGSFNWTRSASESNNENVVITRNAGVIKHFCQEFDKLFKQFSA